MSIFTRSEGPWLSVNIDEAAGASGIRLKEVTLNGSAQHVLAALGLLLRKLEVPPVGDVEIVRGDDLYGGEAYKIVGGSDELP